MHIHYFRVFWNISTYYEDNSKCKYNNDLNSVPKIFTKNVHYFWFGPKALPKLPNIDGSILGSLNAFFKLDLFGFQSARVCQSPFHLSGRFKHDATPDSSTRQTRARDVTAHPHWTRISARDSRREVRRQRGHEASTIFTIQVVLHKNLDSIIILSRRLALGTPTNMTTRGEGNSRRINLLEGRTTPD